MAFAASWNVTSRTVKSNCVFGVVALLAPLRPVTLRPSLAMLRAGLPRTQVDPFLVSVMM